MTSPRAPNVVIGAGAIGSFLAGKLQLAGKEPVALVARGQRLRTLQRDGLRLDVNGTLERIVLPVVAAPESGAPAGLVLLCTKTGDLAEALDLAAPVVGARTALLLVQNGVEAPDIVAQRFPAAAVIASRVHGFFELEADLVRHVGVAPSLELGAIGPGSVHAVNDVVALLSRSGIAACAAPDIRATLWSKFLLAASLGGVALATGLPAGRVLHDPVGKDLLARAMTEVRDVATAVGVALPSDIVETMMAFVAGFPPDATTSLQRDVRSRRASEYDFLPGAVLRIGRKHGVRTPCFDNIDVLVARRFQPLPKPQG